MSDHHHGHAPAVDDPAAEQAQRYSQATWDTRYEGSDRIWSGNPNQRLVEHASGLTPGDALDVGAGEGADAVWLATRGWNVTALDVSPVALARAAAHAAEAGVGDRVRTLQQDMMTARTLDDTYDLVSAQFWHPPVDRRDEFGTVLGAAVRPSGHLLVVGHHPLDLTTGVREPHGAPELLFTPEEIVAVLDPECWEVLLTATPSRPHTGHEGRVSVTDSVVLARRR